MFIASSLHFFVLQMLVVYQQLIPQIYTSSKTSNVHHSEVWKALLEQIITCFVAVIFAVRCIIFSFEHEYQPILLKNNPLLNPKQLHCAK